MVFDITVHPWPIASGSEQSYGPLTSHMPSLVMSKLQDLFAGLGRNDQLELSCWRISVTGWPFSIQQVVLHSQPWLLFDKRLELLTAIGTRRPGSIIHKTVNNTGDGRIICLFLMPVNHPANRGGLKQIRNNSIIKCTRLNSTRIGGNILAHGMDHRRRNLLEILWPRDSWEGISITIGRSWTIDDVKVVLRQICNPSMASGI